MLAINKEQFNRFNQRALDDYINRLCQRLQVVYPAEAGRFDEESLRKLVSQAVERAKRYGLESEHNVALFVDLALFFGPAFDQDPRLPWAGEILNDEFILDPGLRIETLFSRALAFIEEKENHHAQAGNL